MSEQIEDQPTDDQSEYVPDPIKVSMIRLLGVVLVMLGLAIALDRLPPVPAPVGYVLILLGLAQMWAAPVWIIRKYIRARVAEEELAKATKGEDAP